MRDGRLRLPVAEVFPLDRFKEALARFSEPRLGKILLAPIPAKLMRKLDCLSSLIEPKYIL